MAMKSNYIVRGGYDSSKITKGLAKTQKQLTTFKGSVSKIVKGVGLAFGALSVGKLVKDSVSVAMSVESSMNQISRIMGENASEFNKWAQNQSSAFGMAREEAYKYGATYGNLISTFSSGTKETEQRTTELLKASAVVASATGRTMEDTMERIRSGLLGNTESIEDLGINVNVAMLQSTKAFKEFANGRTWQQLSFQEQQQIRLMAILEQANTKYGNSLAGTTATKQMQFLATLKNIRLNLGQAFLPVYNVILPALNSLASKLEKVTATFASFMQAVFGKTIKTSVTTTQAQADSMDNLANATDGVGDSAASTAKKIKKSLAGFDQINTLTDNSTDSSGGGSGGGGASGGSGGTSSSSPETSVTDGISAWDGIEKKLKPLQKSLKKLKKALEPFKERFGKNLKWFYDEVLVPTTEIVIDEVIPEFLESLASALNVLNTVLEKFEESGGDKALKDFFSGMNKINLKSLSGWIGKIGDAFDSLNEVIKEPSWENFKDLVVDIYEGFFSSPFSPTESLLAKAIEYLTGFNLGDWYDKNIEPWLHAEKWKVETIKIKAKIETKWNELKRTWEILVAHVKDKTAHFRAAIATKWSELKNKWDTLKGNVTGKTAMFKASIGTKWSDLSQKYQDLRNNFKGKTANFKIKVATKLLDIKKAGEDLIKSFVKGLKSIKLPKLNVSIGTTEKSILGVKTKVPKLDVNWYKKGGLFDAPSVIGVGEHGKEAVMPLENNTGWITDLAGKIAERGGAGNGLTKADIKSAFKEALKETTSDTIIYVGSEELARANNKGQASLGRRKSKLAFT